MTKLRRRKNELSTVKYYNTTTRSENDYAKINKSWEYK